MRPSQSARNYEGLEFFKITFWWLNSVSVTVAALCSRVRVMVSLVLSQHCHSSRRVTETRQRGPRSHPNWEGKENNQVLRTDHVSHKAKSQPGPAWSLSLSGRDRHRNKQFC